MVIGEIGLCLECGIKVGTFFAQNLIHTDTMHCFGRLPSQVKGIPYMEGADFGWLKMMTTMG